MPFPATRQELKFSGYDYHGKKTCPCGATMELWHTPRGAIMPMNPMPSDDSPAESHWATCPRAQQFRRPKSPAPSQLSLNETKTEGSDKSHT